MLVVQMQQKKQDIYENFCRLYLPFALYPLVPWVSRAGKNAKECGCEENSKLFYMLVGIHASHDFTYFR